MFKITPEFLLTPLAKQLKGGALARQDRELAKYVAKTVKAHNKYVDDMVLRGIPTERTKINLKG